LKEERDLSTPYPPISALPHRQPPLGLGCDPLRRELAITGLDWSFAPSPRSEKRIARQHSFRLPPGFRLTSPCPGLDRPVSSVTAMTPGPFRPRAWPALGWLRACRFPSAYKLLALRLAIAVNSPARVSRRNVQPWSSSLVLVCRHSFLWEESVLPGCTRL
jgi:hypothetical protein